MGKSRGNKITNNSQHHQKVGVQRSTMTRKEFTNAKSCNVTLKKSSFKSRKIIIWLKKKKKKAEPYQKKKDVTNACTIMRQNFMFDKNDIMNVWEKNSILTGKKTKYQCNFFPPSWYCIITAYKKTTWMTKQWCGNDAMELPLTYEAIRLLRCHRNTSPGHNLGGIDDMLWFINQH